MNQTFCKDLETKRHMFEPCAVNEGTQISQNILFAHLTMLSAAQTI
jgi:hypothetical protein